MARPLLSSSDFFCTNDPGPRILRTNVGQIQRLSQLITWMYRDWIRQIERDTIFETVKVLGVIEPTAAAAMPDRHVIHQRQQARNHTAGTMSKCLYAI